MRVLFRDDDNQLVSAEADMIQQKGGMICVRLSGSTPEYVVRPLLDMMSYEALCRQAYATGKLDLSDIRRDEKLEALYDQFDAMYED